MITSPHGLNPEKLCESTFLTENNQVSAVRGGEKSFVLAAKSVDYDNVDEGSVLNLAWALGGGNKVGNVSAGRHEARINK